MAQSVLAIKKHFSNLKDPRINRRKRHLLIDIIVIALCGVICGAATWPAIATFARRRRDWLKRFLALPEGIPSHDTLERVFQRLNPATFGACFRAWVAALAENVKIKQIAIDGKTLRRSRGGDLGPLHIVSAWATANHLSLGQVATAEKSNEITAIPQLLELLDLHGALVTIDAMGCQKEIAAKIVAGGGNYLLTVKDNQPHLLEDIQQAFEQALDNDFAGLKHDSHETKERGHGREERRTYYLIEEPRGLRGQAAWPKLCVIGMCVNERTVKGETSLEARYFIGSKKAGARYYGQALRHHWGIENNLHWQLDVSFGEDANRVRDRNAAENLAQLRKIALGLLKRHPAKESIVCKQLSAAMDTDFLEEVLCGAADLGKL
jgi:predicted transposase YbfD/YdcC